MQPPTAHPHSSQAMIEPLEIRRLLAASIAGLTLIDADTKRPIEPLDYGDTIDPARTGHRLTIRADAIDAASTRFNYDGDPGHHVDAAAPFTIAGERRGGRTHRAWTPTPGTHTLVVTPYATNDASGAPGQSRILLFNVIDSRAAGRNHAPPARRGGSPVRRPERPPATPAVPTIPAPLYINPGGGTFTDSLNRVFRADTHFTGGSTGSTTVDVPRTTDDPLFETYRTGESFSFSHPVANGNYSLWLYFAEPTAIETGERTFDVAAEGDLILNNFDILAAATPDSAIVEAFTIEVADNTLDLAFSGVVGDAIVSAIVLVPSDPPDAMRPYTWLCESEADRAAQSQRNLRAIGVGILMYYNDHKGRLPPDLSALIGYMDMATAANPRSSTLLPRGNFTTIEQRAWVRRQWPDRVNDYVYLGAGRRIQHIGRDGVLAYENPDRVAGDYINVLFGDTHVEPLMRAAAAELIGFPNVPPSDPPPTVEPPAPDCKPDPNVFASADNLRTIGEALRDYANDNRGRYPTDPGTLFASERMDLATFINPRGRTAAPSDDLPLEDRIAWVNAATDYVYFTSGKHSGTPAEYVIAYENPAEMPTASTSSSTTAASSSARCAGPSKPSAAPARPAWLEANTPARPPGACVRFFHREFL